MPPTTKSSKRSLAELTSHTDAALDRFSDRVEDYWDDLCDWLEQGKQPDYVRWISLSVLRRITVEAPVVITFCFLCVVVHVLQKVVWTGLNTFLAVPHTFRLLSVMQVPRLFTHVIAHDGSISHIKNNMVHLLLVGPSAEHVYGSTTMLLVIALVAVTSAAAHILVGSPHTHQLGASGVVFAVILLNSLMAAVSGTIPLSFILTAALWVSDEVYKFFFGRDGVSHHAHLTGAIVGTVVAYYIRGGTSNLETKVEKQKAQPPKNTLAFSPLQNWFRTKTTAVKVKAR